MKKLLIGCGIFVMVAIVAVCGCTMFVGYKVRSFGDSIALAAQDMTTLERDFPFTAPAAGADADPDRFEAYIEARRAILDRTMEISLVAKIMEAKDGQPPKVGPADIFGVLGSIPGLLGDSAKTLRAQRMAPSEFAWHAGMVLRAIRDGSEQGDPQMAEVWKGLVGRMDEIQAVIDQHNKTQPPNNQIAVDLKKSVSDMAGKPVSEANVRLVREHLDKLAQNPERFLLEIVLSEVLSQTLQGPAGAGPGSGGY